MKDSCSIESKKNVEYFSNRNKLLVENCYATMKKTRLDEAIVDEELKIC